MVGGILPAERDSAASDDAISIASGSDGAAVDGDVVLGPDGARTASGCDVAAVDGDAAGPDGVRTASGCDGAAVDGDGGTVGGVDATAVGISVISVELACAEGLAADGEITVCIDGIVGIIDGHRRAVAEDEDGAFVSVVVECDVVGIVDVRADIVCAAV